MASRGIRPGVGFYNWAIKVASLPKTGPGLRATMTHAGGWKLPGRGGNAAGAGTAAAVNAADGAGGAGDGGRGSGQPDIPPSTGWEAATGLLREMLEKGVPPTSHTYTLVMTACRRDGEPERALNVLREMQERAAAAAEQAEQEEHAEREGQEEDAESGGEKDAGAGDAAEAAVAGADAVEEGGADGASTAPAAASSARRRRRSVVAPNVFHYSAVMSAFAEQPEGSKRILTLIKEMEVIYFASIDPRLPADQ